MLKMTILDDLILQNTTLQLFQNYIKDKIVLLTLRLKIIEDSQCYNTKDQNLLKSGSSFAATFRAQKLSFFSGPRGFFAYVSDTNFMKFTLNDFN